MNHPSLFSRLPVCPIIISKQRLIATRVSGKKCGRSIFHCQRMRVDVGIGSTGRVGIEPRSDGPLCLPPAFHLPLPLSLSHSVAGMTGSRASQSRIRDAAPDSHS